MLSNLAASVRSRAAPLPRCTRARQSPLRSMSKASACCHNEAARARAQRLTYFCFRHGLMVNAGRRTARYGGNGG